jgi:molybdopterin molybdotransferase
MILISVATARELVLAAIEPLASERVPLDDALHRVLAEGLTAAGDVPPFACSAMDGYAIEAGPAGRTLEITGESRAGAPAQSAVDDGHAIRISTGAPVPEGATAVIRQEDVEQLGDHAIRTRTPTPRGDNIRLPGEDQQKDATVLKAGTTLGPAELGAAVSAGAAELRVHRRPKVAVLCTGDELRAPGEPLGPGQIHNSNGPMLVSLAAVCGAQTSPATRLPDDRWQTERAIKNALQAADIVLMSGGISVGPHDHVKPALETRGVQQRFWGVALQPGRPTWFGTTDETLVFGLPGNPVSAYVTFALFVAPALNKLAGTAPSKPHSRTARLQTAIKRNRNREQALRVRLTDDGEAVPNGPQSSHLLSSLLNADALAMIPAGDGELPAGTQVALEALPR